jgi:hypothetical protein
LQCIHTQLVFLPSWFHFSCLVLSFHALLASALFCMKLS